MVDNATLYELLALIRENSYFDHLTEIKSAEQLNSLTLEEAKSVINDNNATLRLLKLSIYLDPRYRNSEYKNEIIKFLEEIDFSLNGVEIIHVRNEIKNIIFEYQHSLVLLKKAFKDDEINFNDIDINNLSKKELFLTDDYLKLLSDISASREFTDDFQKISRTSLKDYILDFNKNTNEFYHYKNNDFPLSNNSILNLNLKVDDSVRKDSHEKESNDKKPHFRVKI